MISERVNTPAVIRPGISSATLEALGIRHVGEDEALQLIGQRYAGLFIPYGIHVGGKPFGRLRLDVPQDNRKYTQSADTGVHPYLPNIPGLETQPDLVIVEGEFKAIALCEAGFRAIGISGFYGFMHEGKLCSRLVNHLKDHPAKRILFLGDNDTALNYQFADAAMKLVALVGNTPVLLPRIPLSMPKGVDDCRGHQEMETFGSWWQSIVTTALPVPAKLSADMLAVQLFKTAVPELTTMSGMDRALALQKLGRFAACLQPMARGEFAALCKSELGINRTVLQQAAMQALHSQTQPLSAKEEWKTVLDLFGDAWFMSVDGKSVTRLNERFWAGLVKQQHHLLHEPDEQRFFRYEESTGLWRPQTHASLEQLACDTVNAETQGQTDCLKHAQIEFGRAVVRHLQGMTEKADAFKGTPAGIHVANGYLTIGEKTAELRTFSPGHYSRNQSPIELDPEAMCPMFLEHLLYAALDRDDAALLQYYAGQCLLGRNLTQTILILHGPGGSGKGTLSNVIQQLIGERNCYELRTEHLDERFEQFRYIGKTLLYGADVDPAFLRNDSAHTLKKLVGDDLLSPEGKNSNEAFSIRGNFNVVITCNKRLSVRLSGDVSAWRRRLRIIEFKDATVKRPTIAKFDQMLLEKEGAGILNWAILGAAQVLADIREKRTRPLTPLQQERLDALLGMSDSMREFLEARVEKRTGSSLEKNDLLEAYADFCGEQKWEPLSELVARKELNNRMLDMFGSVERKSAGVKGNQRGYSNVAFIGDADGCDNSDNRENQNIL